ncbi:MAG: hypothetical protein LGB01_02885 [Sulfurovum sp.]|nr:hypothetical protein [Sulfurovum sp.]
MEIFTIKVVGEMTKIYCFISKSALQLKAIVQIKEVKGRYIRLKLITAKDKGILYFVSSKYFDKHVDDSQIALLSKIKILIFSDGLDWENN